MKNLLRKPIHKALGLSIALALGGGLVTTASAAPSLDNLGDMAIVPYYTVNGGYVSGIHITNQDPVNTQIVKVRYNKANNSSEVIDFIVMLSPNDQFTGFLRPGTAPNTVTFVPTDNSCVAPWLDANADNRRDPMVAGQRVDSTGALVSNGIADAAGSTHGYITVIGMGEATPDQQISKDVLHSAGGVPNNCLRAASNFQAVRTPAAPAVVKNALGNNVAITVGDFTTNPVTLTSSTVGGANPATVNDTGVVTSTDTVSVLAPATAIAPAVHAISNYLQTDSRDLNVSYLIRNTTNGIEFGNAAEMFEDFADDALMANQEYGIRNLTQPRRQRDTGFQFPNLNGGSSFNGAMIGRIDNVNLGYGATGISNDWAASTAAAGVATDWVVTLPGQNLQRGGTYTAPTALRIPVSIFAYNREEGVGDVLAGLVVSPGVGSSGASSTSLRGEVTVVTWDNIGSDKTLAGTVLRATDSVLPVTLTDTAYQLNASGTANGWARLMLGATSATGVFNPAVAATQHLDLAQGINAYAGNNLTPAGMGTPRIPVVGFTAWARQFTSLPAASYGRIIQHSRYRN